MNRLYFVSMTLCVCFLNISGPAQADCTPDSNLIESYKCAERELELADKELNQLWPLVREAMRDWDRRLIDYEEIGRTAADSVLKAQRAWIDYRDSTCRLAGFEYRGGTLEELAVTGCLAQLTTKRITELRALIQTSQQ
jgi:uncharacterized protein YecT (DUF1311 family)